jgi:putative acyl-CoA dehydrogenase
LERELLDPEESGTRRLVQHMGLALQASLLVRHGDPASADAFCASRLTADGGLAYGTLPSGTEAAAILARHRPRI